MARAMDSWGAIAEQFGRLNKNDMAPLGRVAIDRKHVTNKALMRSDQLRFDPCRFENPNCGISGAKLRHEALDQA